MLPWPSEALGAAPGSSLALEETLPEDATTRDLLQRLRARYPTLGDLTARRDEVTLALNGRLLDLLPGGLDAPLRDGDEVTILAAFTGG